MTRRGSAAALATLGAVALSATSLVGVHHYALDGVAGLIGGTLLGEDTVYAVRYSDSGFRRVTIGMRRSEVEALIGPPQEEWPAEGRIPGVDQVARWSYSPGDTNYRRRVLLFRNGIVVRKESGFYFD